MFVTVVVVVAVLVVIEVLLVVAVIRSVARNLFWGYKSFFWKEGV